MDFGTYRIVEQLRHMRAYANRLRKKNNRKLGRGWGLEYFAGQIVFLDSAVSKMHKTHILTDYKYATLTSLYTCTFQKTVERKLPFLR